MKNFRVFLKGSAATFLVQADEATMDNYYLTFMKGKEIVARFITGEVQGYRDEASLPK